MLQECEQCKHVHSAGLGVLGGWVWGLHGRSGVAVSSGRSKAHQKEVRITCAVLSPECRDLQLLITAKYVLSNQGQGVSALGCCRCGFLVQHWVL